MKVVIDEFDNEEQAICFVDWLYKQSEAGRIGLMTTDGLMDVQYDGVDTASGTDTQIVVNIFVDYVETYDESI